MDILMREKCLRNCNTFAYSKIYNHVPIIVSYIGYVFQQLFVHISSHASIVIKSPFSILISLFGMDSFACLLTYSMEHSPS